MTSVSQTLLPKGFPKLFSRFLGFDEADRTYEAVQRGNPEQPLPERLLEFMEVTYKVAPRI